METKTNTPPFGIKDKIGYMMGDLGNDFTFIFASSWLMVFYTKVIGIPGKDVATLFLVARIVDAFTDITMGKIVDASPATKYGKFKVWIRRMAAPVAIMSFLMYQGSIADAAPWLKYVYMYVTYLLWGSVFYTAINIPYGSMASAVTPDANQRTELSAFRSVGGTLATLIIGVIVPAMVYVQDSAGNQIIRNNHIFSLAAGIFSVLAIVCYAICYFWTTERMKYSTVKEKNKETKTLGQTFVELFSSLKNRSLLSLILAALFLLVGMMMMMAMNPFIFPDYYKSREGLQMFNFLTPILTLFIVTPLSTVIAKKIGKKEYAMIGMVLGAVFYGILFFIRTNNLYVFLTFSVLAYMAMGTFNTIIWAKLTDVIDDVEVQFGKREDGLVYSLYSFARKVGQAIAGFAGGWALTAIGYSSSAHVQTDEVLHGLYSVTTLVPGIAFVLVALVLIFLYPLNKKKVEENTRILAERHQKK